MNRFNADLMPGLDRPWNAIGQAGFPGTFAGFPPHGRPTVRPTPTPPTRRTCETMSTRKYEAMFLLDNTAATADFEGTAAQVDKILEKHGAELVQKEKWDERKLAYEIKGHRRATYYLVYFRAAAVCHRRDRPGRLH